MKLFGQGFKVSAYVVTLSYEGMEAKRFCSNENEMCDAKKEYVRHLNHNHFAGIMKVHEYDAEKLPREVFDDSQIFFDELFNPNKDLKEIITFA